MIVSSNSRAVAHRNLQAYSSYKTTLLKSKIKNREQSVRAGAINNGYDLTGWHTSAGVDSGNHSCNWTYGQNMQQLNLPQYGKPFYNVTLPSPHTGPGAPAGYRNYLLSRLVAHNVTVNGVTGDYCAVSYDPVTGAISQ
jgi:hypothetical protein